MNRATYNTATSFSNTSGDMAEVLLKRLLRYAGYDVDSYREFSSIEKIEKTFAAFEPKYLNSAKQFATQGSKKSLLDHLGCDFVINDKAWFGLDATINSVSNDLQRKRNKARHNQQPWERLGLVGLGVVRIDYPGKSYDLPDLSELPESYRDDIIDELYNFVDHLKEGKWGSLLVIDYPTYKDIK